MGLTLAEAEGRVTAKSGNPFALNWSTKNDSRGYHCTIVCTAIMREIINQKQSKQECLILALNDWINNACQQH